jgi:hypothetical protein
MVGGLL